MKKNSSAAIWVSIVFFILIAAVGLILTSRILQDNSASESAESQNFNLEKNKKFDPFLEWKEEKGKIRYKDIPQNSEESEPLSKENRIFCWNAERETFEKVDSGLRDEMPVLSRDKYSKAQSANLNGNASLEEYSLQDGKLTVIENSATIWQSSDDWWVEDFALADSTADGVTDINLSVWKSGSFGKSKPFWVEKDDPSVKNHFFVFDYHDGKIRPIWQSSNLDAPNCQVLIDDVDGDGQNELIVLEGDYANSPDCKGEYLAVWKWNEWGFLNEWRSEEREFEGIGIYKVDGRNYLMGF